MSTEDKRRSPEPPWLLAITTDSRHTVAARLGISHTTLNRQLNTPDKTTADLIISTARAYNADPIRALHLAGKLTDTDLAPYRNTTNSLATTTSKVLLQELLRREPSAD